MVDSEDREAFGRALAAARKSRGFSQKQLTETLGSNVQSAVSAWEKGKTVPDRSTVFQLERILDLVPGYLSRHLGYVAPEGAAKPRRERTPEAIENDPDLNRYEKNLLLALYREIRAHRPPSGGGGQPRRRPR